jgi:hypothetical protein
MSMIFRRPMFRRGGKVDGRGTGITSGLDKPRQNYADGDIVDIYEKMQARIPEPSKPSLSLGDYLRIASAGAEILGTPGEGGGISGALRSAARPLATLGTDLGTSLDKRSSLAQQERTDLVKALTAGQAEIDAAEAAAKGDTSAKLQQVSAVDAIFDSKIDKIKKDIVAAQGDVTKIAELGKQLKVLEESKEAAKLRILIPGKSRQQLIVEMAEAIKRADTLGELNEEQVLKQAEAIVDAAGGTGFAEGGVVDMQETMNVESQQPSMDIPFDEFRAKMPANVSDEIVQLIYYNSTAFSDFANIETQDDVYEFNAKYDVNLVLPFKTETT